jgi:hypothetical protein
MPDRTSHKSSSLGVVTLAISVIALHAAAAPRLLLAQEEVPASAAPTVSSSKTAVAPDPLGAQQRRRPLVSRPPSR